MNHFNDETALFADSRSSEARARVDNSTRFSRSAWGESHSDFARGDVHLELGNSGVDEVANVSISGNIYDYRLVLAESDKHGNG